MKVRYTQAARRDLIAVQDYVARRDPGIAFELATKIRLSIDRLGTFPELGRPSGPAGRRQLVVAGTAYIVVYRLAGSSVEVLSIVHGRQRRPK